METIAEVIWFNDYYGRNHSGIYRNWGSLGIPMIILGGIDLFSN